MITVWRQPNNHFHTKAWVVSTLRLVYSSSSQSTNSLRFPKVKLHSSYHFLQLWPRNRGLVSNNIGALLFAFQHFLHWLA
ncbi:hypothetical protein Ahy_B05g078463 isoform D [Arachis hypogaea]|uniref:Uncharacterized protein n=1 Tax=Arachis hypogaea TaxID=3818 RepID=A0A444Z773_ARAHY|nr:hypothetical protein Ahy_B05g078463 isoform D [Arachis hypogaea]